MTNDLYSSKKDLYYLYDKIAKNITMVGLYDSEELAFRDFHYFLTARRLNVSEFTVYQVTLVDIKNPDYNADLQKDFYSFNKKIKDNLKEVLKDE